MSAFRVHKQSTRPIRFAADGVFSYPLQRESALINTMSRLASLIVLSVLLTSPALAQLRLQDVFATDASSTPSVTLTELDKDPARVEALVAEVERNLEHEQHEAALQQTEVLLAWLRKGEPRYEHVLWLRGRAFADAGDDQRLAELSRQYLAQYPDGSHRLWFLMQVAMELSRRDQVNDAAAVWSLVVRQNLVPEPEEALVGADVLNRAGRPEVARGLLTMSFGRLASEAAHTLRQRHNLLLLESLLIKDDSAFAIPDAVEVTGRQSAAYNLRRALLMELRGANEQARETYQMLDKQKHLLARAESELLERRLR
jgi:hypothetical protein